MGWNSNIAGKTFREIEVALTAYLNHRELLKDAESFYDWVEAFGSIEVREAFKNTVLPYKGPDVPRWIVGYAVEGENEGHYIHVEAIIQPKGYAPLGTSSITRCLFLGKTFMGWAHAHAIANACSEFFTCFNGPDVKPYFTKESE